MNRWPNLKTAHLRRLLQRRPHPLHSWGRSGQHLDDFLAALERPAARQNPALRQPWLEEASTRNVKAATGAKGIVPAAEQRRVSWPRPVVQLGPAPPKAPRSTSMSYSSRTVLRGQLCFIPAHCAN